MPSEDDQMFCDWCHGSVAPGARERSRWLGLVTEGAWACDGCLAAGRYRRAPEWWHGAAEDWLAADQYVLGEDERLAICSALNEVLHGPDAVERWEFHTRIGVDREFALRTLDRLRPR